MLLQAIFEEFGREWFAGWVCWNGLLYAKAGGITFIGYPAKIKPAQEVIKNFLSYTRLYYRALTTLLIRVSLSIIFVISSPIYFTLI